MANCPKSTKFQTYPYHHPFRTFGSRGNVCEQTSPLAGMKTPAAKAKGMKPNTKTINAMKTPLAKENIKARRLTPAKVDASHMPLAHATILRAPPPAPPQAAPFI